MGLPDSGGGSSLRKSGSDFISKGIRKSSRKAAKPSSALKKLRFGDEMPDMLPAPMKSTTQMESDISISPSKGNVSNLVKSFEDGQLIDAHCTKEELPKGSLQKPQFTFGQCDSALFVAKNVESYAGDMVLMSRDDADVEILSPVFDDDTNLLNEPLRARSVSPQKSIGNFSPNHRLPSPLKPCLITLPHTSSSAASPTVLLASPSKSLPIEQAALLDLSEAQPLTKLPPIFIPDPSLRSCPSQLPSSQKTLFNPLLDTPTPSPVQTQLHHSAPSLDCQSHMSLLKDSCTDPLAESDFPPLPSAMKDSNKPVGWGTGHLNSSVVQGNGTNQSDKARNEVEPAAPTIAQLFKGPERAGGPVAFDQLKLKDIGSVEVYEGKPLIKFSSSDTSFLAGQLGFALVGKFSHSIPSPFSINKALGNIKLIGSLSWKFLNFNHILINLSESCDYVKLLNGVNDLPVWFINGCPMRMFTWTPTFHPSKETPVVAVWCKLPGLPVHLYDHSVLFKIGSLIGKPLQIDHATAHRERASFARICVEIDLSKHVPDMFVLDINDLMINQRVIYENMPKYCVDCNHVGHSVDTCYAKGKNPRPTRRMDIQRDAGKQQVHVGDLDNKSGSVELSSDGFQKVVYRKKQTSGNVLKSKQGTDVQIAGGISNRFSHLNEDTDMSDSAAQGHSQIGNMVSHQSEQTHKQTGTKQLISGQPLEKQQGKNVILQDRSTENLVFGCANMDTTDSSAQEQAQIGENEPTKSGLVHKHSRSRLQVAGYASKKQQGETAYSQARASNCLANEFVDMDISDVSVQEHTHSEKNMSIQAVQAHIQDGNMQQIVGNLSSKLEGGNGLVSVGKSSKGMHGDSNKDKWNLENDKFCSRTGPHSYDMDTSERTSLEASISDYEAVGMKSLQPGYLAPGPTSASTLGGSSSQDEGLPDPLAFS